MSTLAEQESKLQLLFAELKDGFQKLEGLPAARQQGRLKELTTKMQEAKTLIKDFEKEARMDGMPVPALAAKKKSLVQELNGYIAQKKALSEQNEERASLVGAGKQTGVTKGKEAMTTSELVQLGRKEIAGTDAALVRAQKVVADTIDIGTKTAETLEGQTRQLERVMDDLDEIHFSMRKAGQVMRDMTRGMATDKCLRVLLLAVILGAIALIALRIAGVGNLKRKPTPTPSFAASAGRKLLLR